MSSDSTYEALWKRLLVHAPNLPVPLAQEYINTAYSRILAEKQWSSLRQNADFWYPDPYATGTITTVQDSPTVTGNSTSWTAAMVGRQLIVGGVAPFYDIIAIDTGAQTLTLDRPFPSSAVVAGSYSIAYVYILMPADLLIMLIVRDITLNWKLRLDILQKSIDTWDPKRTASGTGWVLASATPSPVTLTLGRPRMELWPRPGAAKIFTFTYLKRPALLSAAGDTPIYPVRGDCIREGALAELALWPGISKDNPNPYFDLNTHRVHEQRFLARTQEQVVQDEDLCRSMVWYDDFQSLPWAPISAEFIQTHDIF